MPKCEDQDFYCQNPDYTLFDKVASAELINPPTVDEIVNKSKFGTLVPLVPEFRLEDLTHNDFVRGLHDKNGIYHLWVDFDECDDHDTHTLRCVYVGKGFAEERVKEHIKHKFAGSDHLYVGFYECSNRISKYLEQLFLDLYACDLNAIENPGIHTLYAVWSYERYTRGTDAHEISGRSKLTGIQYD
ncbi:hypothetical protein [Pseudoxanthomonas sp.]|uniref:hypothetical protein n=1 Tax=Pseudoxanthomonas sp. TaxID=1871049 RepID=UPI0025D20D9B|nr:hypothetical protein [Pseudoxanthomonas sp.]